MKRFTLVALAAMAVVAFAGVGTASATTLEVEGVTKNENVSLTISLKAETSAILRDTFGFSANTCTKSHVKRETTSPFTASQVTGPNESLTFGNCNPASVTVHNPGQLYVEWTSGTDGLVFSENAEVTVLSTIHGTYIHCKTGEGTVLGTVTGTVSGHATLHVNAVFDCSPHLASSKWTATYTITSPTGLGISA